MGSSSLPLEYRQAETVRGGQGELVSRYLYPGARQDGTRVLGGSGEDHVGDGLFQDLRVDFADDAGFHTWYWREILCVRTVYAGLETGALEGQSPGLSDGGYVDPLGGKRADELGQESGRNCDGALLLDLRPDPGAYGDLQVGCGEF